MRDRVRQVAYRCLCEVLETTCKPLTEWLKEVHASSDMMAVDQPGSPPAKPPNSAGGMLTPNTESDVAMLDVVSDRSLFGGKPY